MKVDDVIELSERRIIIRTVRDLNLIGAKSRCLDRIVDRRIEPTRRGDRGGIALDPIKERERLLDEGEKLGRRFVDQRQVGVEDLVSRQLLEHIHQDCSP